MTETNVAAIIRPALDRGQEALSEYDSKKVLACYGIPVTREGLACNEAEAVSMAEETGYPVALKACSSQMLHKSEHGAVLLHLADSKAVREGYRLIAERATASIDGVLVQEMVSGNRELLLGLIRDPQFGPCVMLGIGGVFTEVLEDTAFRVAPLRHGDAEDMARELRASALLGVFRGQSAADLGTLSLSLEALGRIGMELDSVVEVDINPAIITPKGEIIAADALMVLRSEKPAQLRTPA
ncbi:MAG: acetate--CoA ligase family protein [Thermodesulfobacteriota bacterium]